MAEAAWNKMYTWGLLILLAIVIIMMLYSKTGFFSSAAQAAQGAERYLPQGKNINLQSPEPLPPSVEKARNGIALSITEAQKVKATSPCITSLSSITSLDDFRMEVASTKDGATISILQPEGEGFIRRSSDTIPGVTLCAANPKIIHECYFQKPPKCPSSMQDFRQQATTQVFGENDIAPYLFRIDEKTVCIIPKTGGTITNTVDFFRGCTMDEKGLREKCISQIAQSGLKQCQ